ncbi:oogenesis-related isoform X1 [Oncorhynchus keta]|uniref:oogenesis-related isoform X1 n=1 Tax=Oncorhynchus keta TaxID=8018 RepID=UPI0015F8DBE3|nr:oogenesis-related isoform X1 [Oncorhynchus keta]
MTSECSVAIEQDNDGVEDKVVVKRDSVLTTVLCRLSQFWPVRLAMRALRGFWWLLGFSPSDEAFVPPEEDANSSPARHCLAGRKRLRRATRILLAILPRRLQSTLGYPVCTSIGRAVSPEVLCSPTKLCGKGNKRKQDDLDDDEEQQTWVEALSQELEDEEPSVDPDYEPSAVDTDSEEYNSQNDTESDLDVSGKVVIDDLKTVQSERLIGMAFHHSASTLTTGDWH